MSDHSKKPSISGDSTSISENSQKKSISEEALNRKNSMHTPPTGQRVNAIQPSYIRNLGATLRLRNPVPDTSNAHVAGVQISETHKKDLSDISQQSSSEPRSILTLKTSSHMSSNSSSSAPHNKTKHIQQPNGRMRSVDVEVRGVRRRFPSSHQEAERVFGGRPQLTLEEKKTRLEVLEQPARTSSIPPRPPSVSSRSFLGARTSVEEEKKTSFESIPAAKTAESLFQSADKLKDSSMTPIRERFVPNKNIERGTFRSRSDRGTGMYDRRDFQDRGDRGDPFQGPSVQSLESNPLNNVQDATPSEHGLGYAYPRHRTERTRTDHEHPVSSSERDNQFPRHTERSFSSRLGGDRRNASFSGSRENSLNVSNRYLNSRPRDGWRDDNIESIKDAPSEFLLKDASQRRDTSLERREPYIPSGNRERIPEGRYERREQHTNYPQRRFEQGNTNTSNFDFRTNAGGEDKKYKRSPSSDRSFLGQPSRHAESPYERIERFQSQHGSEERSAIPPRPASFTRNFSPRPPFPSRYSSDQSEGVLEHPLKGSWNTGISPTDPSEPSKSLIQGFVDLRGQDFGNVHREKPFYKPQESSFSQNSWNGGSVPRTSSLKTNTFGMRDSSSEGGVSGSEKTSRFAPSNNLHRRNKSSLKSSPKEFNEPTRRSTLKSRYEGDEIISAKDLKKTILTGLVNQEEGFDVDDDESSKRISKNRGVGLKKLRKSEQRNRVKVWQWPHTIHFGSGLFLYELADILSLKQQVLKYKLSQLGFKIPESLYLEGDDLEIALIEAGCHVVRVDNAEEKEKKIWRDLNKNYAASTCTRPPFVSIMGHIDHGKTTLLDYFRKSKVVEGESGGITQHLHAAVVKREDGSSITFLDTPGHQAFQGIRKRGAALADMAVLVISSIDGVKDQTLEALKYLRENATPFVIAYTKIDHYHAQNIETLRQELLRYDVVVESMGGDVLDIGISAKTGENIDALLDKIMLQSEMIPHLEVRNTGYAKGVVTEILKDRYKGYVVRGLVDEGVLKMGDMMLGRDKFAKIRTLLNESGQKVDVIAPGFPFEALGFESPPQAGEMFYALHSEKIAKTILALREDSSSNIERQETAKEAKSESLPLSVSDWLRSQIAHNITSHRELPLILKGDSQGSLEGLVNILSSLRVGRPSVQTAGVRILNYDLGHVNDNDLRMAKQNNGILVLFNITLDAATKKNIEKAGVETMSYSVIYHAHDDMKRRLFDLLDPVFEEKELGVAIVKKVFNISKEGLVAGCLVDKGIIRRGAMARIIRDKVILGEGEIRGLKRLKESLSEATTQTECGILLRDYKGDYQPNDRIVCFLKEKIDLIKESEKKSSHL